MKRVWKITENVSWAACGFHQVESNIKPQVSAHQLSPCFHLITLSYGTQVLHLSLHRSKGCQYAEWLHLCVPKGNPNWSFMALKAAKQARAAASSPGRRQTSHDPVLLPTCQGHGSLLPVAHRHAVDWCSQRMLASGTREIWEKERDGGCTGDSNQLSGVAGRWETLICSPVLGHSPSAKCRRALSSPRTRSPWSCTSGSLPTWPVCSDDWHKLLLEDEILALLW